MTYFERCGLLVMVLAGLALPPAARAAAPSADSVALARNVVDATATAGLLVLNGVVMPYPPLMRKLGVPHEHAGVIVHDVVVPMLNEHGDELTDIQVNAYATLLSMDDMKAIVAFYNSPAGKHFKQQRFSVVQANMKAAIPLVARLTPELDAAAQKTLTAHGWAKN